jgi:hypothetical protein
MRPLSWSCGNEVTAVAPKRAKPQAPADIALEIIESAIRWAENERVNSAETVALLALESVSRLIAYGFAPLDAILGACVRQHRRGRRFSRRPMKRATTFRICRRFHSPSPLSADDRRTAGVRVEIERVQARRIENRRRSPELRQPR